MQNQGAWNNQRWPTSHSVTWLPGRGRKSQRVSLMWQLNMSEYGAGRQYAHPRHDAKMWQWGNSVTAYCVMSPRFPTYCEGDERKKKASNGFSMWWKGAPADGASVSLFLKTGWQRMRGERWKKWMSTGRNTKPIVPFFFFFFKERWHMTGWEMQMYIQLHGCNMEQLSSIQSPTTRRGWLYRPCTQLAFLLHPHWGLTSSLF